MLRAYLMLTAWLRVFGAEGSDLVIPFPILLLILVVLGIAVLVVVLLHYVRR